MEPTSKPIILADGYVYHTPASSIPESGLPQDNAQFNPYEVGFLTNINGAFNIFSLPFDLYQTISALFKSTAAGDSEEYNDAALRLLGIPANAFSAVGTILSYGAQFGILKALPAFLGPAALGAGIGLCVIEGIVDLVSLYRQTKFEQQFDFAFLSHLRRVMDSSDPKSALKAAREFKQYVTSHPDALEQMFGKEQGPVVAQRLLELAKEIEHDPKHALTKDSRSDLLKIARNPLINNLQTLREEYLEITGKDVIEIITKLKSEGVSNDDFQQKFKEEIDNLAYTKKKKLARRARPWMLNEGIREVNPLLKGVINSDDDATLEGLRFMDDMHTQSDKQKLTQILGVITLGFAVLSLVGMLASAPTAIPFILLGIALTIFLVRAGIFAGTLNSRGWTFEPSKILPEFIRKKIFGGSPEPLKEYQYTKATVAEERSARVYDNKLQLNSSPNLNSQAPLEKTIQPPQQVLVDEQKLPLEKNEMRYTTLDAILTQLKDPLYAQAVKVNGATWKGPEKLRDKLLEEKYTEEQIIYILNQIEFQTFATPLVDARDKLG
ncbi:MAG: hypothetical protein KDK71_10100, partial [Chlamydiia bacterium]|nr:hypothetical protein [Chlamydiia bacterium]